MAVNIKDKLDLLRDTVADDNEFDRLLGKMLEVRLSQHQQRLRQYRRDLQTFEKQFAMDSAAFYQRFEAGELGDQMDFFEWAGLYEMYQEVQSKVDRLAVAI